MYKIAVGTNLFGTCTRQDLGIKSLLKCKEILGDQIDLFNKLLSSTKRKVVREKEVYGFVVTNSIRFDGTELGINNIYDASLATNFIYNFYNKISIKAIIQLIKNTYRIFIRHRSYKIEQLPQID